MPLSIPDLIARGLILQVPDVPDTNVYQLQPGVNSRTLQAATTKSADPSNDLLRVHDLLGGSHTPVPPDVAANLSPGPFISCAIGSTTDLALQGFPSLVKLVASYNSTGELMAIEGTPVALPGTSGVVRSGAGEYVGYTVRETSGSASASIVLKDALSNTGAVLEEIDLNPGETASDEYDRPGRLVNTGIYAVITGAVEGSVFV